MKTYLDTRLFFRLQVYQSNHYVFIFVEVLFRESDFNYKKDFYLDFGITFSVLLLLLLYLIN